MNRGRSRRNQRRGNSSPGAGGVRQSPRPRDQPPPDRPYPSPGCTGISSKEVKSASSSTHEDDSYSLSALSGSKELHIGAERKQVGETPGMVAGDGVTLSHDFTIKSSISCQKSVTPLLSKCSAGDPSPTKCPQTTGSHSVSENYEHPAVFPTCHVNMNRGRSRGNQRRGNSSPGDGGVRQSPRPRDQPPPDRPYPSPGYTGISSKEVKSASSSTHERDSYSLSDLSGSKELHIGAERKQVGETPGMMAGDGVTLSHDFTIKSSISCQKSVTPLLSKCSDGDPSPSKCPQTTGSHSVSENYEHPAVFDPFDICPPKTASPFMLNPPLLVKNRERRNEIKRIMEGQDGSVLRSGMVLLKSCISLNDQVKIVKMCRDLGLGPGGFYQPGYRDGAKLHLKMMCLGKNWDPETSRYGERRLIDGAKPPIIPHELNQLVEKAIKDSHSLIGKEFKAGSVEQILPWMSPNICIVNFYSSNGRLGLHQDRDESRESLSKELPVVSFSIGDAAEFLYGDESDVDKADKIVLESGDVLIFGGKSRHVFHGVTAIKPNTAPKALLETTKLRPGRLNLTFREY